MKKILTILFWVIALHGFGQSDTGKKVVRKPDTTVHHTVVHSADTAKGGPTAKTVAVDTSGKTEAQVLGASPSDSSSLKPRPLAAQKTPLRWDEDTAFIHLLTFKPLLTGKAAVINEGEEREPKGKEQLFYILAGLLVFIGAVKTAYPKYFGDIFRLFIQASQRQKQTPEQIVQGYVPGFLCNILFFLVGGMLITLYGVKINYVSGPLWLPVLYCAGILAGIYLLKYLVTTLAGWVFNVKDAAGMYNFIIFLINRVIGILLLPVLILIAFYDGDTNTVLFTIAASLVFFLLVYRYALSLTVIRKNLKVNALHFFIYLCAVELMPLLVIYKELFNHVYRK